MDSVALLRQQLANVNQFLEGTMDEVTANQAQWAPPGTANPLGATYAHTVSSLDAVVNGILQGKAPLFASE